MITRPAFAPANVGVRFLPQGNHVAGSLAFDDTRHVPRHSGHDPLVLIRVGMAVVVVGDEDEPAAVMDAARQPEIRPLSKSFLRKISAPIDGPGDILSIDLEPRFVCIR